MKAIDSCGRNWIVLFMLLAAMVTACGPEDGAVIQDPLCSYLPEPAVPRAEQRPLTPEAALRKCEVEHYVAQSYLAQGYHIVATTENYDGDIMDWMSAESVPGSEEPTPPPISLDGLHLPPGVELGKLYLEDYPEMAGPAGSVGFHRWTFPAYVNGETGASSLDEVLHASDHQRQPTGQTRLYTGYGFKRINLGTVAYVNAFGGTIETGTISLMEMAVVCDGQNPTTTREQIGIAASRDKVNFNYSDSKLRLQVEFHAAGDDLTQAGWHGSKFPSAGFVPRAGSSVHAGDPMWASVVGGSQYEHRFTMLSYQGNWWLGYQQEWFGYYPGSTFDVMSTWACEMYWYTEVYDPTPSTWTWTDGGSGEFAEKGPYNAAYFKRIHYVDIAGVTHWLFKADAQLVYPNDSACYTTGPLVVSNIVGEENSFYAGGPGEDPEKAPSCH